MSHRCSMTRRMSRRMASLDRSLTRREVEPLDQLGVNLPLQLLEVLAAARRPCRPRWGWTAATMPAAAALVAQAVELRDPLLQPRHRSAPRWCRSCVQMRSANLVAAAVIACRRTAEPALRFRGSDAVARPACRQGLGQAEMLCWARHFGLCFTSGAPATRAAITGFGSFGICQKIGLPITSSAFFKLIPSSTASAPRG